MKYYMLSQESIHKKLLQLITVCVVMFQFTYSVEAQVIRLWSNVMIESNSNIALLKWEGVKGVDNVQYRLMDTGEWKTVAGKTGESWITEGLDPDKTYQWRLVVNSEPGAINYFRTFKLIDQNNVLEDLLVVRAAEGSRARVSKIYSDRLQFYYMDDYQLIDQYLLGELFDKERSLVSKIAFKRKENHTYLLEPSKLNVIWEQDQTYVLVLKDDLNPKRQIKFQISEPLGEDLQAEISANPITIDCQFGTISKIEYYGTFEGGNAPYEVIWSIANADDFSQPLSEPTKLVVEKNSFVPKITIEYPLPYLVVFSVLDGCGNFGEHSVVIQCTEDEEDEFSLLFESVDQTFDDSGKPGSKR